MRKDLLFAASICLICSCNNDNADTRPLKVVETTAPAIAGDSVCRTFAGIVEEARQINLAFKIAGQISAVNVTEGQKVSEGQLLATLDDSDYKLEKDAVEIQYKQLSDEVERTRVLYGQKSVSKNDFEKAEAGLRQLGIQLQGYENKLAYTRLYAPIDCYIQTVNFDPGEMVNAGTTIFELIDASQYEVAIDVPATVKMQDLRGTTFLCTSQFDGTPIPIRLKSIVPKADGNQLYRARFAMPAKGTARITPGMNVEVTFKSINDDDGRRMSIAASAILNDSNRCFVWQVMPDSTLYKCPVTIGHITADGTAYVTSGLDGSETIVKSGGGSLHAGQKVRIMPAPSETNVGGLL